MAYIGVVICQFAGLLGNGLGHFLTAIADIHAVKPSKCVQKTISIAVGDVTAACGLHDPIGAFAAGVLRKMC